MIDETLFFTIVAIYFFQNNNIHMKKELEKLEIKVSYLEAQNEELNECVIDFGKKLTQMMAQIEEMKKKIKDLMDITGEERESRKPPHY